MTSGAVDSLRADREALLEVSEGLDEAQWKAPSGCEGWSVQDVVVHMAALFWQVVDRSVLPDTGDLPTEAAQEVLVAARRDWSSERVLEDYRDVSVAALDRAAEFERQDFEVDLGGFGKYKLSELPNAYAFDHYTHIRADLFAPRGPLVTEPPPSDELRLRPTLAWIAAALPQHSATAVAQLPGAVEIEATGVAPRTIVVGDGAPIARIVSDGPSLVRWITQRGSWEQLGVDATGDEAALRVARTFKVY